MHFGKWHPISEAGTTALEEPGVLQTRAEGAMDYRSGRSAMVLYACTSADETLRGFVAGRGARDLDRAVSAGARWIRFAPTPEPRRELDRLLERFVELFGSPPISNAGTGRRSAAKAEEEPR
ncbi:MAG TPA: hypothetical protein VN903_03350 [Polyangia bacterium]|nr:hypothetical protein [Polyangia bacterium]